MIGITIYTNNMPHRIYQSIKNLQEAKTLLENLKPGTDIRVLFSEMNFRLDQLVIFSELIKDNIKLSNDLNTSSGIISRCPICSGTEFIKIDNFYMNELTCKTCLK